MTTLSRQCLSPRQTWIQRTVLLSTEVALTFSTFLKCVRWREHSDIQRRAVFDAEVFLVQMITLDTSGQDKQICRKHPPCSWRDDILSFWIWMGYVVRSQYWLLYTMGVCVCACYWVFEPQIRRPKSVMVSAWWDMLAYSWRLTTVIRCMHLCCIGFWFYLTRC